MLRRFSVNFALFSMILDALGVVLSLWSAATFRPVLNAFSFFETIPSPIFLPTALYILFPLTWVSIYSVQSIYDGRRYLRAVDEFAALTLGMLIAAVSAAGILYFSYRDVSRALFLVFVIETYLSCLGWRAMARLYFRSQKALTEKTRRVLIVGGGSLGQKVRSHIVGNGIENLAVVGYVDESPAVADGMHFLGKIGSGQDIITKQAISDVVIALPHSAYHQMSEIVGQLEELPVRVWVALGFFDLALYKTGIEDFAGIPMLDLRASAIDDYQRLMKRAFDLLLGSLALIFSLPVMGLLALAILMEDGRPVIFRQKRAGENGRQFEMLKFRTMVKDADRLQQLVQRADADGNLVHKTKDDPRVTRVGRVLRRFSLDELPQLMNILNGTMSLVGPRPELPYLVEKYQPWQRKRFAVPPGLTGWWQVNGRSDKPMHLHTEDDLYYIQNYSIWLDLQIILRTAWAVLFGRGAY
jgi:exopolysaccharide biosynthesis polyprenyl glycosylphosphotransferase